MNCRDFDLNVLALARNELIDSIGRQMSLAHTENCVRCANRLSGERALFAGVRAVVKELAEERAPAHVGAALLAAFRAQTAAVTENTVVPMPPRVTRHWRLEAAAAILILVSVLVVLGLFSRLSIEKQIALTSPAAAENTPQRPGPAVRHDLVLESQTVITPPNRAGSRAVRHKTKAAEEVTEFFPLMEGIDLDSLEAVQAVRVELPASALMDLGLQSGSDLPDGPVKADVLLGHDGLARAIRFVR
jgi:hypothetical protein